MYNEKNYQISRYKITWTDWHAININQSNSQDIFFNYIKNRKQVFKHFWHVRQTNQQKMQFIYQLLNKTRKKNGEAKQKLFTKISLAKFHSSLLLNWPFQFVLYIIYLTYSIFLFSQEIMKHFFFLMEPIVTWPVSSLS